MAGEETREVAAVADASPLVALCSIGQLQLLGALFRLVYIPQAVWDEVVVRGEGRPGTDEVPRLPNIELRQASNRAAVEKLEETLGPGEAEALVLMRETDASILLVDEIRARRLAEGAGVHVLGTAGILLLGKRAGLVPQIKPLIEELVNRGFRLGRKPVELILREAGEPGL